MSLSRFPIRPSALANLAALLLLLAFPAAAAPALLNHQGRMAVNGVNFEGPGQFKFALVNTTGTTTYWSNDGTGTAGSEPAAAVSLTVVKGLYAVLLGDTSLTNMSAVPAAVFDNADVRLRVWFNDGTNGFQQITPDQRLAAAPWALNAAKSDLATTVPDGSITGPKIAAGAVSNTSLANSSVTITPGTGLSGGGLLSLGGSATLTNTGVLSLTSGGGITVSAATGAITLGSSATNNNTAGTIVSRDASGNFAAGTITGSLIGNATSAASFTGALAGDVTGTQSTTVIAANSVNSSKIADGTLVNADISPTAAIADTKLATIATAGKVANSATTGTTASTPNTLVLRDGTGKINGPFVGDGSGLTGVTVSSVPLSNIVASPASPVVTWGNNADGQNTVPSLSGVAAVSAGSTHRLVLLDDGTVVSWGTGPAVPAGLTGITNIAAGCGYNLALRSDGTVTAWGVNTYGQTTVPAGLTTVAGIAAGERHSVAFRTNGTVAAWGDNTFGQTTVPATATGVTAIACGYDHTLALKSNGTVVAWGRNDADQCDVPAGLTGVVAIGAGSYHSLAVKSDGSVVAWGWDQGGQSTVPPGLTGVTKVAGGYSFSIALKTDGTIVSWGDNSYGQADIPSSASEVVAIAASSFHAIALRAGTLPAQLARLDEENVFIQKLGIGRVPANNMLEVEGDASKSTAGSWLSNSDRRIKTEIQPVTGALEKLDQVRLVDFRYTDEYRAAHPGISDKRYLNVIAQEFAKVFPDDVKSSGEKMPDGSPILQVDTYPLTIYSAAAVQELHRQNEALNQKVADQDERIRKLEAALNLK